MSRHVQWIAGVTGYAAPLLSLVISTFPARVAAQDQRVPLPPALQRIQEDSPAPFGIELYDEDTFDPSVLDLEQLGVSLVWTVGRSREGAAILKDAIEREPRLVSAPLNLAFYFESILADTSAAVVVLESAIAHRPDQPVLHFALANVHHGLGDHDAAIDHDLQALKLGFRHASVYYKRLGQ